MRFKIKDIKKRFDFLILVFLKKSKKIPNSITMLMATSIKKRNRRLIFPLARIEISPMKVVITFAIADTANAFPNLISFLRIFFERIQNSNASIKITIIAILMKKKIESPINKNTTASASALIKGINKKKDNKKIRPIFFID
jgi:hypothetical protein